MRLDPVAEAVNLSSDIKGEQLFLHRSPAVRKDFGISHQRALADIQMSHVHVRKDVKETPHALATPSPFSWVVVEGATKPSCQGRIHWKAQWHGSKIAAMESLS